MFFKRFQWKRFSSTRRLRVRPYNRILPIPHLTSYTLKARMTTRGASLSSIKGKESRQRRLFS